MSANILDEIISYVRPTWDAVGFEPTPFNVSVTLTALLLPFLPIFFLALTQRETPLAPPTGCQRVGLQGRSNLRDQYAKTYANGGGSSPANPWIVKALFIYPVKSCSPVELDTANVIRTGFQYDRQFAFGQQVTSLPSLDGKVTSEWVAATLRTFPRLAKVEIQLWIPDPAAPDYDSEGEWVQNGGCIVFRFPFTPDSDFSLQGLKNYGKLLAAKLSGKQEPMLEFRVPFNPTNERMRTVRYTKETYKIWKDTPLVLNMSNEVPVEMMARLKYTLGVTNPFALFRIDPCAYREVHYNAPKKEDVGFQTIIGMQDAYPLHIQNLASVHHVSSQLPRNSPLHPLNALRFRPNVVITGPPAFAEDSWRKARIGSKLIVDISCRTTRCKLPNVDPQTGIADPNQPLSTMLKYRVIDAGSRSACLGMQVSPLGEAVVKVGDEVEVLEEGEHRFLK